jgi:hypothetical protein
MLQINTGDDRAKSSVNRVDIKDFPSGHSIFLPRFRKHAG